MANPPCDEETAFRQRALARADQIAPEVPPDERAKRIEAAVEFIRSIERRNDLRFAVGSAATGFSSPWIAWASGSDFYIAGKHSAGSLKISLHPPKGIFPDHVGRIAMPREYVLQRPHLGLTLETRAHTQWKRPEPPSEGAHCSVIVTFPTKHLRGAEPAGKPRKPLLILESAPADGAVEVGFFHSRERKETLEPKLLQIGKPILRFDLSCGASVSLVARHAPFDPKFLPTEEAMKKVRSKWMGNSTPPNGTKLGNLIAHFWNDASDGTLRIVEVGGVTLHFDS